MYRIPNEEIYTIGAAADPRPKQQVFLPEPFQWSFFPAFLFRHLDPPSRQLGSPDFWITSAGRFFFSYRSKQSTSSTDDREKGRAERNNEVSIYRNIILFIGILCRDFKLIAIIVGDYRKGGGTLIILSLSISSKMLARCCLRIRQPRRNRFEY